MATKIEPDRIRPREWVSIDDPDEERTWLFDVTFLASPWTCIYGHGCQGVLTGATPELEQGCCSYGAHFTAKEDARKVERMADELDGELWQFLDQGRKKGVVVTLEDGDLGTRMARGACIFLNRPGFPGGAGCALHKLAERKGISHVETKPEVCWQVPLRREDTTGDDGRVISTIKEWGRSHWGDGGSEFHWWCTEAAEAFVGREPVYRSMRNELEAMAGATVYRQLAAYMDERTDPEPAPVPLPHPTVRSRATADR